MDCILIQDGKAHQIWPNAIKGSPAQEGVCYKIHDGETEPRAVFPQAVIDGIVEVESGSVVKGAAWDGHSFTNPAAPAGPTLAEYAASKRYEIETAGVTVTIGGHSVPVSTARGNDREVLTAIFVAIGAGLRQDGATFKFADGSLRAVSNADMTAAIGTALARVQAAFDKEREVLSALGAGTVTTTVQIDAAFAAF